MATRSVTQTEDFNKQSHLNNSCSLVSKTEESKNLIALGTSVLKEESNIKKKKYCFNESETIKQYRIQSLGHWPHFIPNRESMISAGWFSCNINDRVLCIYCHKLCEQWTINDDPSEVHQRISPQCPFVLSMPSKNCSPKIINDKLDENFQPSHPTMAEVSKREATFSKIIWPENSPSIENLVRAGFYCTGVSGEVTCFYCNGSLHKWGPNDNPMVEHARWFPHCDYAKHLCGNNLYGKIQSSKKNLLAENKIDPNELRSLVVARLDLPVVERLRSQYSLPLIKRCIEDQFKIKNDDFESDSDLSMACLVLQKQIDILQNSKHNFIIPSKDQQLNNSSQPAKKSLGECFICLTEEKKLACMPCGHLCACVPCGYALKSCPICRQHLKGFISVSA
ncbi:unnamed protein product [Rotaria magnacalcarata]|uniref:RING-type domain-containing protein n=2 Tax=Rotaria magnacalcarata TaxID=392030 RepID=A0A816VLH9_9BILA|nr:unnamed protein product [Rotaria magnacalcarata]CAF2126840.1 unnamed protein product [Rotaria magnacalcarata]CAF3744463.1 unnamed protein product [Rotaria magnacalcarata]CAF3831361.1 unnamed protein product [Rotaria magnacalcarata]